MTIVFSIYSIADKFLYNIEIAINLTRCSSKKKRNGFEKDMSLPIPLKKDLF